MAEVSTHGITVQVCHALPDSSFLRALTVPAGTTIQRALEQIIGPVFGMIANSFVDSFCKRAETVYGGA